MPYLPSAQFANSVQADMFRQAQDHHRRQNMLAGRQERPKGFVYAWVYLARKLTKRA